MNILALLLITFLTVNAQTWVSCTDYRGENDAVYDDAKCFGYPRNWDEFGTSTFGDNDHYAWNSQDCNATIHNPVAMVNHTIGTVRPEQRVCLAWPSKQHQDYENVTVHMVVYHSTMMLYDEHFRDAIIPFEFLGCPGFDTDPENSVCTGCYTVWPRNILIPFNKVSAMWFWPKSYDDYYTTCFDLNIDYTEINVTTEETESSQATEPTEPEIPEEDECQFTYQCLNMTKNYNFVECVDGKCVCKPGFLGAATVESKCNCEPPHRLDWLDGEAICYQQAFCFGGQDWECPPRKCIDGMCH